MRTSRVLPILAVTAAVLMTSAAVADGSPPVKPPHTQATAPSESAVSSSRVLLYGTSNKTERKALRIEICSGTPIAGMNNYKVDVKTLQEPVDPSCLNAAVPAWPQVHDTTGSPDISPLPRLTADMDNSGVTVSSDGNPNEIPILLCQSSVNTLSIPINIAAGGQNDGCTMVSLSPDDDE